MRSIHIGANSSDRPTDEVAERVNCDLDAQRSLDDSGRVVESLSSPSLRPQPTAIERDGEEFTEFRKWVSDSLTGEDIAMAQFEQPIEALLKNDKAALFKWCFNRCHQAFNVIYEYEETKMGSLWRFDERYYEHGITILHERFCYAMAIIVDRFHIECVALYDANDPRFKSLSDVQRKTLTFQVLLSGSVDEIFKRKTRDLGWSDATLAYCDQDYTSDPFARFWERHEKLQSDITALRNTYAPDERNYLQGFADCDYDEDDDERNWNLDFLFMMRICSQISGDVVVEKFLGDTKLHYLPTIIKSFMTVPKMDVFAQKPPAEWWQFWKR